MNKMGIVRIDLFCTFWNGLPVISFTNLKD